ncbi:NAD(P)-binding protein [Clavulina sp. PMI_390]|nr:NAD(P)-binding protein [Clavulina sp. PMI_390]
MSIPEQQKLFFRSPAYAVVGASTVEEKYGTKVLKWYKEHDKTVTPIHPKEAELQGLATLKTLSALPSPGTTSVSIVTPPKVTLSLLKEAKDLKVPAIWLQPGADDDDVREYIKEAELEDRVVLGGPCVLVEGEGIGRALAAETEAHL